jgi:hypothetical protein
LVKITVYAESLPVDLVVVVDEVYLHLQLVPKPNLDRVQRPNDHFHLTVVQLAVQVAIQLDVPDTVDNKSVGLPSAVDLQEQSDVLDNQAVARSMEDNKWAELP